MASLGQRIQLTIRSFTSPQTLLFHSTRFLALEKHVIRVSCILQQLQLLLDKVVHICMHRRPTTGRPQKQRRGGQLSAQPRNLILRVSLRLHGRPRPKRRRNGERWDASPKDLIVMSFNECIHVSNEVPASVLAHLCSQEAAAAKKAAQKVQRQQKQSSSQPTAAPPPVAATPPLGATGPVKGVIRSSGKWRGPKI